MLDEIARTLSHISDRLDEIAEILNSNNDKEDVDLDQWPTTDRYHHPHPLELLPMNEETSQLDVCSKCGIPRDNSFICSSVNCPLFFEGT